MGNEKFEFRNDESNYENTYSRNRIRNIVIPFLKKELGDSFENNLTRMSKIVREEEAFWDRLVSKTIKKIIREKQEKKIVLERSKLKCIEPALLKRVLRQAIYILKGDRKDIESVHIEYMVDLIVGKSTGKRLELPSNLVCENIYDDFVIMFEEKKSKTQMNYTMDIKIYDFNKDLFKIIKVNRSDSLIQYFDYRWPDKTFLQIAESYQQVLL